MNKIRVHLLGNPCVEKNNERVHFPYKKAEGFFYYLCVKKNTTREELISILWNDDDESSGRKSLREAIYQIKKLFGKDFFVTKGNSSIGINLDQDIEIDWDKANEDTILNFENQDFMSHFMVKNSCEFENWLTEMQEQYNHMYISSAKKMLETAKRNHDEQLIKKYGNMLLLKLPYDEEIYCELMEAYAISGDYNMAVKIYNDLRKVLSDELGVKPADKTRGTFFQIFELKEKANFKGSLLDSFFYGRSREMFEVSSQLKRFFNDEEAQNIFFCGEPGIGKSTLMKRIQKNIEGYHPVVFQAKSYREEHHFFLNVWQDIFQEILQHEKNSILRDVDIKEEKKMLSKVFNSAYLFDTGEEDQQITFQIVEHAFIQIIQKISLNQKIVIFIDDIHWMDSMSILILNRMLLACDTRNVYMIASFRQDYEDVVMESFEAIVMRDGIKILYLKAFLEAECNEIINFLCPSLTDETAKKKTIYQTTCGNPFFLMEMLRIIQEKGYTLEKSQKTINVIKCRLAFLSEEDNQVLNIMSIFPEKVSMEELDLLLPMDKFDLISHLENLKEQQLIQEQLVGWELQYLFKHKMFQEYVYERQSIARKILYHKIIAEYYEKKYLASQKTEELLTLIYHYECAHNRQKTYEYKVLFFKKFYLFFHENFPLLDTDVKGSQLLWDSPFDAEEIVRLAKEIEAWEDEAASSMQIKMEVYYIFGRYGIAVGEYEKTIPYLEKCVALAKQLKDEQILLNCYKQFVFYGDQVLKLDIMEDNIKKGLALLSEKPESDDYGVFIRLKGLLYLQQNKYEEAEKLMWEAIGIFEKIGHDSRRHSVNISGCYNYLGNIRQSQGKLQEAIEFYKKAIENNTHQKITNGINQSCANLGKIYYKLGEYDKARRYLTQAIQIFEKHRYFWGRDSAAAYLALVEIECKNYEAAKSNYLKGKVICDKISNPEMKALYQKIDRILKELKV